MLTSYDKYLRRNLKLRLRDLDGVYSKIIDIPNLERKKIALCRKGIYEEFHGVFSYL